MMLETLKKFWGGVPKAARLFLALIFFAIAGAWAADLLLFFIKDETAQIIGIVLGVLGYAVLAVRADKIL